MTRQDVIKASAQAASLTVLADQSKTELSHKNAAAAHRIVAEMAGVLGDSELKTHHGDVAVQHDLAASNCHTVSQTNISATYSNNSSSMVGIPGIHFPQMFVPQVISSSEKIGDKKPSSLKGQMASIKAAERMSKKHPLMAKIADGGFSLNNLQDEVRQKVRDIPEFKEKDKPDNVTSCVWVADIVAPEHEDGETWTAIVNGANGKLYAVMFVIKDKTVTISGDPKEVQRSTDYDYIKDIVDAVDGKDDSQAIKATSDCGHLNKDGTFKGGFDGCVAHMQGECGGGHSEESAKKICGYIAKNVKGMSTGGDDGLESGGPGSGRRPQEASDLAEKKSAKANAYSQIANNRGTSEQHSRAAQLHIDAANAHAKAMMIHHNAFDGDREAAFGHAKAISYHQQEADKHYNLSDLASDDPPPGAGVNSSRSGKIGLESGDSKSTGSAVESHKTAGRAHLKAAEIAEKEGNSSAAAFHRGRADAHAAAIMVHQLKSKNSARSIVSGLFELEAQLLNQGLQAASGDLTAKEQQAAVNVLVLQRAKVNKSLSASLAEGNLTVSDIQTRLSALIKDIPEINKNDTCPIFPADIIPPVDDEDSWTAIVYGTEGKLFAIDFNVDEDGDVSIEGDPELVQRDVEYDYVQSRGKGAEGLNASESGGHYIEKCSCGKVIGQCRCSSPNKEVRIIENGCADCAAKVAKDGMDMKSRGNWEWGIDAGGPGSGRRPGGVRTNNEVANLNTHHGAVAAEITKGNHVKTIALPIGQSKSGETNYSIFHTIEHQEPNSAAKTAINFLHSDAANGASSFSEQVRNYGKNGAQVKYKDDSGNFHHLNFVKPKNINASENGKEGLEASDQLPHTAIADTTTEMANQATNDAESERTAVAHQEAADAHQDAYDIHKKIYDNLVTAGADDTDLQKHLAAMEHHAAMREQHRNTAAAIGARDAAGPEALQAFNKSVSEALESGDYPGHPFRGNQYAAGGTSAAGKASDKAHSATKSAKSATEHRAAAAAHMKAAVLHDKKGDKDTAMYHRLMAQYHDSAAHDVHGGRENHGTATKLSEKARQASVAAAKSGKEEDHKTAEQAHREAAAGHKSEGNEHRASKHAQYAEHHAAHGFGRLPTGVGGMHHKKHLKKGQEQENE